MENNKEQFWKKNKKKYMDTDGLQNFDKIKKDLLKLEQLEDKYNKIVNLITDEEDSKKIMNISFDEILEAYENKISNIIVNKAKYIDLDFVESNEWIEWVNDNAHTEKVTSDEKLIAQYHNSLYDYIENYNLILNKLKELKDMKTISSVKNSIDKFFE